MRVVSLHVYPLKSGAGLAPDTVHVEPWGIAGDRRWMVVDAEGVFLSAREEPRLFHVRVTPEPGGALLLQGPHLDPLRVMPPAPAPVPVRVQRDVVTATPAGAEADAWLGQLLERTDVRLVWLDDPRRRPSDPKYSEPGDLVSLADGFPLLVTTLASLGRLNDWIAEGARERGEPPTESLPMQRFRPNMVIDPVPEPFAEDTWKRIRVGDMEFRVVKPCARCVMTTIHPETLAKGKEPLRTLARRHKWNGSAWFGMNLIPVREGELHLGDPVSVLE
ncbi:MOSC domain-containing protein [Pendulispora albinea]|uniref:MOSC domain-containing protein n=1 Tax=Pendulispora albinea TaxID=2741071 RepID=A0ABZ2M4C5_9BACT